MELVVLVMDSQNALDFLTRALTLSARTLMDAATRHQQETVKLVRPVNFLGYWTLTARDTHFRINSPEMRLGWCLAIGFDKFRPCGCSSYSNRRRSILFHAYFHFQYADCH